MELSILLGKVIGLFYVVAGLGFLFNGKYYREMIDGLLKNQAIMYLWSMMAIVAGLFLIFTHNFWVSDWSVIITIIGWLALVKGVLLFLFPGKADQFLMSWRKAPAGAMIEGLAALILGLIITYLAFMA